MQEDHKNDAAQLSKNIIIITYFSKYKVEIVCAPFNYKYRQYAMFKL